MYAPNNTEKGNEAF